MKLEKNYMASLLITDKEYCMSSGRDEWMSNWSQETKREVYKPKTPLERMYVLRDSLKADLERIEHNIKEYEDAEKKTI